MKLHADDLEAARAFQAERLGAFVFLTDAQRKSVRAKAKAMIAWRRAHPRTHDAIGVSVVAFLFAADVLSLVVLPQHLPFESSTLARTLAAAALVGFVHGAIVCSIVTFSVHEGAAHDLIVQGRGRIARVLRFMANNACRLFLADPTYYAEGHFSHHRDFGTPRDGSFTSHVRLGRLLGALAPLAPLFSASDYFPWRPQERTKSRLVSSLLTKAYLVAIFVPVAMRSGLLFAIVSVLVVGSWVSFALDRVRESTEHVFLPLDRVNGTRDLGLDPWGLLLGGGPWGQPCHFAHHLEPALAWYQQIALHFHLRRILDDAQKKQFFVTPIVGFPALLLRLVTRDRRSEAPRTSP